MRDDLTGSLRMPVCQSLIALIRKIQGNEHQIVLKEDFKRSYHIISNALIVTHERDEGARLLLAALHLVNQLNPVNTDTEGGGGGGGGIEVSVLTVCPY